MRIDLNAAPAALLFVAVFCLFVVLLGEISWAGGWPEFVSFVKDSPEIRECIAVDWITDTCVESAHYARYNR